jgi:CRISPR-associated protein Csy2
MSIRRLLVLPHLKVHNANALSSPVTIGFPAMTAWLGFVHALQRKLNSTGYPTLRLVAAAVISHGCDLQTYRGPGDFEYSIVGTGNPLEPKTGKDKPEGYAERPSFIEEPRCHLDVSLMIEYQTDSETQERVRNPDFMALLDHTLMRMKVAGGDLESFGSPELQILDEAEGRDTARLMRRLMPGFALIERRELMQQAMEQGQDALDAMLDYLAVHHTCEQDDEGNIRWVSQRKLDSEGRKPGWIVPIATGFQGISALARAKNQRDPDTPHRFAESVVTLGEFRMVHRIQTLDEVLWRYHADLANNLYLCQQLQTDAQEIENDGFY